MSSIQSVGVGQSLGYQQVSTASAGAAAGDGAAAASAMSYSSLSVSMESHVETFMAQYGGDRLEQLLRALILLLILLQVLGDDSDRKAPEALAALGEQFGSVGNVQMAAASYQAFSLVQSSAIQVSASGIGLGSEAAAQVGLQQTGQLAATQQIDMMA